ncbi:MAG: OadG family protein [bacterium]|nr:OadG family protein [bacterium]
MNGNFTSEMGTLTLVGVAIVFSVLSIIALVVAGFKKLDDHWQTQEESAAQAALEKDPTIDSTSLVLISAAVATVVGGRFRVRKIHRLLSPKTKRTPWSSQGRLTLQGSHTIRRKK